MSTSLTLSPQNSVKLNTIRKKINVKDLKNEIKKISSTETKKDVSNSYAVFDNPSNMKAELIEDYDAIWLLSLYVKIFRVYYSESRIIFLYYSRIFKYSIHSRKVFSNLFVDLFIERICF